MTWIVVNYWGNSDFETWDICPETKTIRKKTSFIGKVIRTLSLLSYIPTTLSICSFIFKRKYLLWKLQSSKYGECMSSLCYDSTQTKVWNGYYKSIIKNIPKNMKSSKKIQNKAFKYNFFLAGIKQKKIPQLNKQPYQQWLLMN